MKYEDFKQQVKSTGLTLKAFAHLLGINPISISNFKARGEVPDQLGLIACFMADYKQNDMDFMELFDRAGLLKKEMK
jgi:hypothetical protein